MPYIKNDSRAPIQKDIRNVNTQGDLNYLITCVILQAFKGFRKYEMIHELRKNFVTEPKHNTFLNKLRMEFADKFTVADIYTAAGLAFEEFYRRVGRAYEKAKIKQNGDLPEYQEVLTLIEEDAKEKAVEIIEPPKVSLIIPGGK